MIVFIVNNVVITTHMDIVKRGVSFVVLVDREDTFEDHHSVYTISAEGHEVLVEVKQIEVLVEVNPKQKDLIVRVRVETEEEVTEEEMFLMLK